jgi:predicted O-linked N-acetylglucosamine transferase (SPINDLY family)
MTVRASGPHNTASAARTKADAVLIGWRDGAVSAATAVAELSRIAAVATDYANLGVLARASGDARAAQAAYERAITLDPACVPARYNLGNLLLDEALPEAAATAYEAALRLQPDHARAWNGLGLARQRLGQFPVAETAFANAIRHAPDWAEAHLNHGVALFALERHAEARAAYRACLDRDPRNAAAYGNLGALLLRAGHPIAAEQACRQALALAPDEHRWHANLAVALQHQARHTEAEAAHRAALALRPDYAGGHGTLLFALNYRADLTDSAIIDEYRNWDATHARALRQHHAFAPRDPARRLRIGYLSPDFRQHAVALFAEPLITAHDRARVELFLYAELAVEDAVTARFRALADHWRPTIGHSDHAVAAMIRADAIDVLIDLGGHTANARPLVLARKPAPLQLAYPLGHGTTSGLSAMDGILTDAHIAPAGTDTLFIEKPIRLPRAPFVYQPPEAMPDPVTPRRDGPPVFGHFGRAERLTEPVIAAWSAILRAVPGSRLILDNRPFQEPAFRALFVDRFARHGIATDQLDLRYTTPQEALWRAYHDLDIALDPFPHNAGTTTIEALWMGVPVLTLANRPGVGRLGASILSALGLEN